MGMSRKVAVQIGQTSVAGSTKLAPQASQAPTRTSGPIGSTGAIPFQVGVQSAKPATVWRAPSRTTLAPGANMETA